MKPVLDLTPLVPRCLSASVEPSEPNS